MRFDHAVRARHASRPRTCLLELVRSKAIQTHRASGPKTKKQNPKGRRSPGNSGRGPKFQINPWDLPFDFSKCSDFCGIDLADYKSSEQMTKSCRYHPKDCAGLASRNLLRFCHLRMITKPKNEITNRFESCHPCFHKSQKGSAQIPKCSA